MSTDAWVLVQPSAAFRALAVRPAASGLSVAMRRPLLVTFVSTCVVSLVATGTLTARLVLPPMLYLSFLPLTEILALAAILHRRRPFPFSVLIDRFFAGHAAWMLLLLGVAGVLALAPPAHWWTVLTRVSVPGLAVVIVWSAYVDFCFFRHLVGDTARAALRDLIVHRAVTWLVVFAIFAAQELTPWGLFREISEAVAEVLR